MNTKMAAQDYESVLRRKLANGEDINAKPKVEQCVLFKDFAHEWFETSVRALNKPSEISTKNSILRKHLLPFFGGKEIKAIDSRMIEQYKISKLDAGLSRKSVNNHLTILLRCLRVAEEWGRLDKVPKVGKLKTESQRLDFLSPVESIALVKNCDEPMWKEMLLMALRTGMRLGELFGLDWSDVDFDRKMINVRRSIVRGHVGTPKSNKTRYIPMTNDLARMIYERRQRDGLVFHREDGTALSHHIAENAMRRACKKADMRYIGWHTLRHTFASTLVSEGVPLNAVQNLLGHANVTTTMCYAHLAPSALQSAVDVLDRVEEREMEKLRQQAPSIEQLLEGIKI
ncbi:MAG: site-specific integrase [Patescibacteria group bacterium]|nr:site-specific integrase [Patescibacteria group bacterium]